MFFIELIIDVLAEILDGWRFERRKKYSRKH